VPKGKWIKIDLECKVRKHEVLELKGLGKSIKGQGVKGISNMDNSIIWVKLCHITIF
jgi:hypothetical protein